MNLPRLLRASRRKRRILRAKLVAIIAALTAGAALALFRVPQEAQMSREYQGDFGYMLFLWVLIAALAFFALKGDDYLLLDYAGAPSAGTPGGLCRRDIDRTAECDEGLVCQGSVWQRYRCVAPPFTFEDMGVR